MPFSHAPVGGQGNLVVGQVQSPNFNAATGTGWRIAKDGSAQFYDVILPGGQGVSVFFAGTAPVTDHVGDLWYDTANGLALSRWSGTAWVAYQIGAAAVSFTATDIGGITYTISAPPQPATPNTGDIWQNSVSGKLFQWDGTAWVQFQFGTGAIAPSAITAAQIEDLSVTVDKFKSVDHYLY